jgi:hypothetical protein
MQIFEQEIQDGLADKLKSCASITYASIVEPSHNTNHNVKHIKSLASLNDDDLYYVQSILVTSNWNKNDDIFNKEEVWVAKNTPEDKPTNLNHDENTIVGHITSNWPITDDGVLIDPNTPVENLPEKFHILTGSVVYKGFSSQELVDRTNTLISEIQSGKKYVSMECFFKGFDYGLLNKSSGEFKILNRNSETAFLTKYLRSYGGLGEHDNYKIGRVLRNITFSGKGFVDKPANPDSIIFTKNNFLKDSVANNIKNFSNLSNIGVFDIQPTFNVENMTMNSNKTETVASAEEVVVNTSETTTPVSNTSTETVADTATETVVEADVAETNLVDSLNKRIAELESQVASQLETIEAAKKMKEEEEKNEVEDKKESKKEEDKEEETEAGKKLKEEMAKKDEEIKKVKSELDVALETIAGYKMKEQEMAKKEKDAKRKAALLEQGVEDSVATETVNKFENLDDESFETITQLLAAKKATKKLTPEDMTNETTEPKIVKDKAAVADESVLDSVEVEQEVNLGIGGEVDSAETTRAALVEFVSSRLGKK